MHESSIVPSSTLALKVCISLVAGTLIVLFCLWSLWDAKWSVYADHEWNVYMGTDGKVGLEEIPGILLQTEVGHPGEVTRYRPTTYFMYVFEAYLWGQDTALWHAARVVTAALFVSTVIFSLAQFFPILIAILFAAWLMTAPYWAGVWIGIGPNEQYIILFGLPFAWSYARLYGWPSGQPGDNRRRSVAWVICALSAALLVGTKENMFILLLPLAWLGFVSWKFDRKLDYRLLLIAAVWSWAIAILLVIVAGLVHQGGTDFYGNSTSIFGRLQGLISTVVRSPICLVGLWLVALGCFRYFCGRIIEIRPHQAAVVRLTNVSIIIQTILIVAMLAHAFFYGEWPGGINRYGFPGNFFAFLALVQVGYFLLSLVRIVRPGRYLQAKMVLAGAVLLATVVSGHANIRNTVAQFVASSQTYTSQIKTIVSRSTAEPDVPIVVEAANPYDLEAVFSVNRFLKMRGVSSPIYLRLHDLADATFPDLPFFYAMIDTLTHLSKSGFVSDDTSAGTLPSPFLAEFSPIAHLPEGGACFAITLADAPTEGCEVVANVRY